MLKITVHDGPEAITFQVEGKLIGAWAKELERSESYDLAALSSI